SLRPGGDACVACGVEKFLTAFTTYEGSVFIITKLLRTVNFYTGHLVVTEKDLTPNKHLAILWEARERLHRIFVSNNKRLKDLVGGRPKTSPSRRYAKWLSHTGWFDHSATFNERTGTRKRWPSHKALAVKSKTPNTTRNTGLATNTVLPRNSKTRRTRPKFHQSSNAPVSNM
ncbi:hypothetical protein HPB47_019290, partial [Ixodes persulcatus]